MDTLEQQLTKETILESNCQNAFRVLKTQFEKIFSSVLIKPSSLDVQEVKALDAISEDKAKKSCMSGFQTAFATLFGQDVETFIGTMFLNMDQLEKQLNKEEFQEIGSTVSFKHMESVKKSIDERAQHKREYDSWVNERQIQTTEDKVDTGKAVDASLVNTESIGTESKEQDTSSRSGNDAHADDADIRPIYDEEPMVEWKPTGKIFKTVGLRWVPTGKIFTSSTTTVDSEPQNGSNADISNQYERPKFDVSAGTSNLSAAMTSVHNSSGLAPPRQMTSDHNSSELGIHDHSNELSSSKLVPKVVPPADKTATSRQELELLFHHHITMLRIMSSITAQQTKLDLELVPKEKRLDIGKCNGRLNPGKIQREPTFQVVLDALALTPCYSAFLITADVPEVYMHQFWDSVYKHDTFYRFKIDKRKRFKLNMEIFRDIFKICRDIFKICPRVHGLSAREIRAGVGGRANTREKLFFLKDLVTLENTFTQ
ncbi:hypothetical protein Tco_1575623 [Tanacetum coccineum]